MSGKRGEIAIARRFRATLLLPANQQCRSPPRTSRKSGTGGRVLAAARHAPPTAVPVTKPLEAPMTWPPESVQHEAPSQTPPQLVVRRFAATDVALGH